MKQKWLPELVPAKKAFREAELYMPKIKGGQKLTWLKLVEKDKKNNDIQVLCS